MDLNKKFPCKDKYVHYNRRPYISEKGLKVYLPFGKKAYCWFVLDKNTPKCIIYECERCFDKIKKQYYTRFERPYHVVCCFKDVLTISIGTIIYGTIHENQFFFERIYYMKGKPFNDNSIVNNMIQSKNILQHYVKNNVNLSLKFVIPIINYSRVPILEASNLPYCVYEIVDQNNNTFRMTSIIENLEIESSESNDVYYMFDKSSLLINDFKTSHYLREKFSKNGRGKYVDYRYIEKCDYEESDDFISYIESKQQIVEDQQLQTMRLRCMCLYIPERNKWKPYMKLVNKLPLSDILKIKCVQNKKYINNV
jgi:hypothetical protein